MASGDVIRDVRHALRSLGRTPGFAIPAIASIALSAGITAVVFAAVQAVLLDPLPYAKPEELVQLATDFQGARQSDGDYVFDRDSMEIGRRAQTLAATGTYQNAVFDLAGDAQSPPLALYGLRVSASVFPLLGVSPLLGRNILPEEDRTGGANVVILSHGLWTRRFAADPGIVGRTVKLNARDYTVIGVMPSGFTFPIRRTATRTPAPYVEFWAPQQMDPLVSQAGAMGMVARLRPGISLEQARAELDIISRTLAWEFPTSNRDRTHRLALYRERLLRNSGKSLLLLFAMAALFLLLGCANVASLLLARGLAREREFAVRMAIGAGRGRLLRQLLTESAVLALLGGTGGFALAQVAWQVLPSMVPVSIPRLAAARADGTVLLFTLAVAVAAGLLFGVMPALRAADVSFHQAALGARGGGNRLRRAFVMSEVAITVLLVALGGQFGTRFVELLRTDTGFDADHTFAAVVLPAKERYPAPAARAAVYRRFLQAVRELPGVELAGTVDALPFSGENHGGFVHAGGPAVVAEVDVVGGDYLQAMGVGLQAGRWFREEEMRAAARVAIISAPLAQRLWPGQDALGRSLCVHCTPEQPNGWTQVIGVVPPMRHASLEGGEPWNVYLAARAMEEAAFVVVRTKRPAAEMDGAIRAAIAAVDPAQPVLLAASLRSLIEDTVADRRFLLLVLGGTAVLALLLATGGVYALAAYATRLRTREIGIRLALGGTPVAIHGLLLRQGLVTVCGGVACGIAVAMVALRLVRGFMAGFESAYPVGPIVAAACVLLAGMAACWIPARQATGGDPLASLRQE